MQPFKHVAIIGLGLIGGSIAKRLKECGVETASFVSQGVDQVIADWEELISWSDLVVLATPLSSIPEVARQIKTGSAVVIDVGSVKGEICTLFESLTQGNLEFVATHPMAGKEVWGYENSEAGLFEKAPWIVTPHRKNREETLSAVSQWIALMGADPKRLSAEEHDEKIGLVSHLPSMISRSLWDFIVGKDASAMEFAGPGFQSMTRLAKDNPVMQEEIARCNGRNLKRLLEEWIEHLKKGEER